MVGPLPPWSGKASRPLSRISLRVNKKSHVSLLTPLNPIATSSNICCHPTLEWTLFWRLESSTPHTILWVPTCVLIWILHVTIIAFILFSCEGQSCASSEKLSRELCSHTCCTDIISVRDNCVSPQGSFCVNFKAQSLHLYFPLWETIVCLLRGALAWTL